MYSTVKNIKKWKWILDGIYEFRNEKWKNEVIEIWKKLVLIPLKKLNINLILIKINIITITIIIIKIKIIIITISIIFIIITAFLLKLYYHTQYYNKYEYILNTF